MGFCGCDQVCPRALQTNYNLKPVRVLSTLFELSFRSRECRQPLSESLESRMGPAGWGWKGKSED